MAISGKTPNPFEIPFYLSTDKPPDMAAVTKAMADRLHALLVPSTRIRGAIAANGAITVGTGFTCERTAAGKYTIKLTTELPSSGVMLATPATLKTSPVVVSHGKKEFKVEVQNTGLSELIDGAFNFELGLPS